MLEHAIRRIVFEMLTEQAVGRHGIVQSVDPHSATVRVTWDEHGLLSGWLPVAQPGAGAQWSVVSLPTPGTQVFCVPDMGDSGSMVVVGSVHSAQQQPGQVLPYGDGEGGTTRQPITPGEVTLQHRSGASLRLTTDTAGHPVIEINGDLKVNGNLIVSGDVFDQNRHWGSLNALRQAYDAHQHPDPQGGQVGTTTVPVTRS